MPSREAVRIDFLVSHHIHKSWIYFCCYTGKLCETRTEGVLVFLRESLKLCDCQLHPVTQQCHRESK